MTSPETRRVTVTIPAALYVSLMAVRAVRRTTLTRITIEALEVAVDSFREERRRGGDGETQT